MLKIQLYCLWFATAISQTFISVLTGFRSNICATIGFFVRLCLTIQNVATYFVFSVISLIYYVNVISFLMVFFLS